MHWECEICGYMHDDEEPPVSCPVCGAPHGKFIERFGDEDDGAKHESDRGDDMDDFERDLFADYDDQ